MGSYPVTSTSATNILITSDLARQALTHADLERAERERDEMRAHRDALQAEQDELLRKLMDLHRPHTAEAVLLREASEIAKYERMRGTWDPDEVPF